LYIHTCKGNFFESFTWACNKHFQPLAQKYYWILTLISDTLIKGSLLSGPIPRGKQECTWEFATLLPFHFISYAHQFHCLARSKPEHYLWPYMTRSKQTNMWTLLWFNLESTRPSTCVVGAMQTSCKSWGPSFCHKKLFYDGPKLWGHKYGHYGTWQLDSKNRWTSLSRLMGSTGLTIQTHQHPYNLFVFYCGKYL
jgi:hypothetical protein